MRFYGHDHVCTVHVWIQKHFGLTGKCTSIKLDFMHADQMNNFRLWLLTFQPIMWQLKSLSKESQASYDNGSVRSKKKNVTKYSLGLVYEIIIGLSKCSKQYLAGKDPSCLAQHQFLTDWPPEHTQHYINVPVNLYHWQGKCSIMIQPATMASTMSTLWHTLTYSSGKLQ